MKIPGLIAPNMKLGRYATLLMGALALAILVRATPAHAQHGDYVLGTIGIMGAQQPPEGLFYQNLWSYYTVSGSGFINAATARCASSSRLCLSSGIGASGSLDLFVDQNIFWLVTPLKFPFINGTYGASIDVPLAIASTSGAASLQPTLAYNGPRNFLTLIGSTETSEAGTTKGTLSDIYFEPIDLGWHFKHLDAIFSGGFLAPTGPYNPKATVNIGYGHWTGLVGLGGILYPDDERTWSLTLYLHYQTYGAQEGHPYTIGDQLPFEWAVAKSFNFQSKTFQQLSMGPVGYAQWQITDNSITVSASTEKDKAVLHDLEELHSRIYAAGPGVQLLTSFGLFDLRYYQEFGSHFTPSGQQLMFSFTVAGKPWG